MAIVKGQSTHDSLTHWTSFKIEAIDEKPIPFLRLGTLFTYKVSPGTHKFLIKGGFSRGNFGICPCEGRLVLVGEFKPNRRYVISGGVRDNRILAWIEDADSQERISEIAEEPYVSSPKDNTFVIVI